MTQEIQLINGGIWRGGLDRSSQNKLILLGCYKDCFRSRTMLILLSGEENFRKMAS